MQFSQQFDFQNKESCGRDDPKDKINIYNFFHQRHIHKYWILRSAGCLWVSSETKDKDFHFNFQIGTELTNHSSNARLVAKYPSPARRLIIRMTIQHQLNLIF